jgi:hypothetical protein
VPIIQTVTTDFRRIVECLHSAHYTDGEIVDYLEHFFGVTAAEAIGAVNDAAGNGERQAPVDDLRARAD